MQRFLSNAVPKSIGGICLPWFLGALFGCGSPEVLPAPEPEPEVAIVPIVEAGDLVVEDARVQLFGEMGAAFFVVRNTGTEPERLLRIESPRAASVETHETVADGSVMRMEPREDGFPIPPGETLRLKPGGKHAMLLGLMDSPASEDSAPANTFLLRLVFEHQGTVEVPASVRGLAIPGGMDPTAQGDDS